MGDKTTNAKARTAQAGGVKNIVREIERTQLKPPATNRAKKSASQVESAKLEIHADRPPPIDEEEDIEYAPPSVPEIPYESDIIRVDDLDLSGVKPENQLRGSYEFYYDPRDDDGVPLRVKKEEEEGERYWKEAVKATYRDIENMEFNVGVAFQDRSAQKNTTSGDPVKQAQPAMPMKNGRLGTKPLGTMAARKAASALSIVPKPVARSAFGPDVPSPAPTKSFLLAKSSNRPVTTRKTSAERATAVTASRSTLGYSKGRNAQTVVQGRGSAQSRQDGLKRSVSTASAGSGTTVRPASNTKAPPAKGSDEDETRQLDFLSIFDIDEDDDAFGISDDVLLANDLDDEVELKFDID